MSIISFAEKKAEILKALKNKEYLGIQEQVELIDGFINQPFTMQITQSFEIGGPTIPMVMLLGQKSGRVYLFALKKIINV